MNYTSKIKSILMATVGVFVLASCQETAINDVINPGDKPVMEAYLAPGKPVTMHVFTEIPYYLNDTAVSVPISGLEIKIVDNKKRTFILKSLGEGLYTSAANELVAGVGSTYDMSFSYKGRTVAGSTIIPPKPVGLTVSTKVVTRTARDFSQPRGQGGPGGFGVQDDNTPIQITWQNPDKVFYFVASESAEANPLPINTLPADGGPGGGRGFGRGRFNNEPVQGVSNEIRPQSFQYFGKTAIILYRLNPDYAALYKSGGSTTQNISTPPTSIQNGLGIFTGVNADTVYVNVIKKVL
jgi:Domain of unknown function (DUF4249)